MPLLLDTNVLSEIRRLKPEPKVLAFIAACPLYELYISAVTLAELRFGIERLNAGQRRDELTRWLIHTVRPMFDERILSVTEDILFRWRVLLEEGAKSDIPIRNRTSLSPQPRFTTGLQLSREIEMTLIKQERLSLIRGKSRPSVSPTLA